MSYADLTDAQQAALEAERVKIERHVRRYVELLREDDHPNDLPIIQEWVVGVEWTNVELEQSNRGGRDVIMRDGGTISAALGLGVYIRDRFGAS